FLPLAWIARFPRRCYYTQEHSHEPFMLGRAPVTDEQDAEAAARVHAQSIVEADMGTMVRGMTPDGLASAMALGNTTWNPLSYELELSATEHDDFVYHIT